MVKKINQGLNPLQVQTKHVNLYQGTQKMGQSQSPIGTNKTFSYEIFCIDPILSQSPIGTNKTFCNSPLQPETSLVSIPYRYKQNESWQKQGKNILSSLNPLQVQTKRVLPFFFMPFETRSQSPIGTNKTFIFVFRFSSFLPSQSPIGTNKTLCYFLTKKI